MHVVRQKGRGRKKKKRRRKRLPRSPRPRPVSGCCLRSTRSRLLRTARFYCGYMFLPRSRRLCGTISTLFLREGGPWLLRSILTVTCPHGFLQAQDVLHLGRYGPEGLYAASPWPHSSSSPAFACAVVVPVLRNDSAMYGQTVQNSVLCSRSCCSSAVVFLPFVPQRQIPMVQTVQQTTEIPQLPFVF